MELCFGQKTLPGPLDLVLQVILDGFLEAVLCRLLHRSPVACLLLMPSPQSYLPCPAPSSAFTLARRYCLHPSTLGESRPGLSFVKLREYKVADKTGNSQGLGRSICFERVSEDLYFHVFKSFLSKLNTSLIFVPQLTCISSCLDQRSKRICLSHGFNLNSPSWPIYQKKWAQTSMRILFFFSLMFFML